MPKHMVDISGWNTNFTSDPAKAFASCMAAGIDHAYIKATEGKSYKFPKFIECSDAAYDAGMLVGAYHFARADATNNDAKEEAQFFLDFIAGVPLQLAPVLDIESSKWWVGDSKGLVHWCLDWCQIVAEATGRKPIIYTGPGFWASSLGRTAALQGMRLWVAAYPNKLPESSANPPVLGNWKPSAWQYTGHGKVHGVDGEVDLSYVYDDLK